MWFDYSLFTKIKVLTLLPEVLFPQLQPKEFGAVQKSTRLLSQKLFFRTVRFVFIFICVMGSFDFQKEKNLLVGRSGQKCCFKASPISPFEPFEREREREREVLREGEINRNNERERVMIRGVCVNVFKRDFQ